MASAEIYPSKVHGNLDGYGIVCIVQAGGRSAWHPDATTAGAMVMVQAVQAWQPKVPLKEYATEHKEQEIAIKFWGM